MGRAWIGAYRTVYNCTPEVDATHDATRSTHDASTPTTTCDVGGFCSPSPHSAASTHYGISVSQCPYNVSTVVKISKANE